MKKNTENKIKICTKCGSTSFERTRDIGICKDCGSKVFYNLASAIFYKIKQR